MGSDTALAVLSDRPRLLYDYFAQLFAQVTNPPLDAIREELVTSMASTIGPERNLLEAEPEACRQIKIEYPILHNDQVAKLRHLPTGSPFRSTTLPLLYNPDEDGPGLERAMAELCRKASQAVAAGYGILILSDRGVDATHAPIPSLLATAGVHHHLVREGTRTKCGLLVETRRRARGASRRAAHGLRRRRGQPVPRVRDAARPDSPGPAARRHPRPGGQPLREVAEQGRAQGDVEDGHLDAAELLRRADLRGGRPRSRFRRQVLHVHRLADRRRRPADDLGGSAPAACAGVRPPAGRARRARERRRIPVAPRRRNAPVQPGDGVPPAARHAHGAVRHLQGIHAAGRRPEPAQARRCAACSG